MAKLPTAAVSILMATAMSGAFLGPVSADPRDPPRPVISASGKLRYVVQNPNNCAPWLPMPVYAKGQPWKILGYRCYYNPNG